MSATSRLEFIARTQLTGTAASVSFATGLSGFTKFFVVCYMVNDANNKDVLVRVNNDSGANYARQRLSADAASVASGRVTGATSWEVDGLTGIKASNVGMFVMELSKPVAGAVCRSTWRYAYMNTDATAAINFEAGAGEWTNTADLINRIDVIANANNFTTGTRILLYGSKD